MRGKKTISYFRVKNKGEISEHLKPVNLYCHRSFGGGLVVPKSRLIPQGDEGVSIRELRNLFLNHFYRQDFMWRRDRYAQKAASTLPRLSVSRSAEEQNAKKRQLSH